MLRRCADAPREIRLVTPSEYLAEFDTHEVVAPAASSWGEAGHSGVWLDPSNAWMQSHLHATERRMGEMARTFSKRTPTVIEDRTLSQLARELLLAQASDWPFLIRTGTAREYAEGRAREHLLRFAQLRSALVAGSVETEFLENCEWRDNIFPRLDWRIYA